MSEKLSPEELAELGQKMADIGAGQEKIDETLSEIKGGFDTIKGDMDLAVGRMGKEMELIKSGLGQKLGLSGRDDFFNETAKFLAAVHHKAMNKGVDTPDSLSLSNGVKLDDLAIDHNGQKAAADFTTGTAGSPFAGFLIPEILRPGIIELKDIIGNIIPRLTAVTVPAGANVRIPRETAKPTATWRAVENVAITEEATPYAFTRDTLNTTLLGTYIQISNELISNPSINFGAVATARLIRGIMRKLEDSVLQGNQAAGATDPPTDGILIDANVNDQGTYASATFALVVSFLQDAIADNEVAFDPSMNQIIMTPSDLLALASEAVGATELTGMLVWGDPRRGIPTTLLGYEVIAHPSMQVSTGSGSKRIALGDLASITLGQNSAFAVDINPWLETAYKENSSWLRVFNHYDYSLGQPSQWHKGAFTA